MNTYARLFLVLFLIFTAIGFTDGKGIEQLKVTANKIEATTLTTPIEGEYFETMGVEVDGVAVQTSFKVLSESKDGQNGTVAIQSKDDFMSAIHSDSSGDLYIPVSVKYHDLTYDIVAIGVDAFSSCVNLTSTGLENNSTVTTIGDGAYSFCHNLITTGLEKNNTVTRIGDGAFTASSITSTGLDKNSTVTTIGYAAFSFCLNLTSTELEKNSTVTTIEEAAFAYCVNLTSTGLENNNVVTTIESYAFNGCTSLDDIILTETNLSRWGVRVFINTEVRVYYLRTAIHAETFLNNQGGMHAIPYDVASIQVKTPSEINYEFGDSYDPTDLVITASYIVDSKTIPSRDIKYIENQNDFSFSLSDNLTLSDDVVTITYGGKTDDLKITVSKKKVDIPTVNGSFTENGKAHKLVDILENYDAANVILTGDIEKTAAGNYTGVATLKDPENYEFKDSKETSNSLNWVINKKPGTPDKEEDNTTDNGDKGTSGTIGRPSTTPQGDGAVVKTGDASSTRVLFALLSISMLYGCIVFIRRRKYNK